MNEIRKYEISMLDSQVIPLMGKLIQPLTAQMQRSRIVLWALIDPEDDSGMMNAMEIRLHGTGRNPAPDNSFIYLSTMQDEHSGYVWHLFWRLA
jgi:hypothetical protein